MRTKRYFNLEGKKSYQDFRMRPLLNSNVQPAKGDNEITLAFIFYWRASVE